MRRLTLVLILLIESAPAVVHASTLTLYSSQQIYQYGDNILIVANVTNIGAEPVKMYIEHSMRDLQGRVSTAYLLSVVDLGADETRTVELYDLKVDDWFYSGQYVVTASVIINKVRVSTAEIWFTVEGAPEDMEAKLIMSSDPDYQRISHVFIRGEKIYISLTGAPQGAVLEVKLRLPDNSTQPLTLPASLTAKQVGEYVVAVNASATGYRDIILREGFSVLGESPESLADRKEGSSLSLALEKTEYTVGDEVMVSGEIAPPHSGASVVLSYSLAGSVEATRTATTDDDGRYQDTYEPSKEGAWSVEATWAGDSNHLGAESQSQGFNVEAPPMNWLPIAMGAVVVLIGIVLFLRRKKWKPQPPFISSSRNWAASMVS